MSEADLQRSIKDLQRSIKDLKQDVDDLKRQVLKHDNELIEIRKKVGIPEKPKPTKVTKVYHV